MDSIDKNILLDLLINCRITYQEMSSKYKLSANGIKKRISNMVAKGVIKDYYIELSLKMVDAENSMAIINTDGTEDKQEFTKLLGKDFRVNTVGYTSGGSYMVFALYTNGSSGLADLSSFYRNFSHVKGIEVHPLVSHLGNKDVLSRTEMIMLRHLLDNPKIPISEITKKTEIPSQTVSKSIKTLQNNGLISFSVHFNPNAGDWITFIARVYYEGNLDDLLQKIGENFQDEYFIPAGISATNPLVFLAFIVNELRRVSEITQIIKKMESITSVVTILGEPSYTFSDLRIIRLKEMISEAGV